MPPRPQVPAQSLGFFRLFGAMRTNLLTVLPAAAFEEDVVVGSGLLAKIFLINAPDAIHRVLVENAANYHRSAALIRVAGPFVGNGLLLSEGDDWRQQRRTIAPALAQRAIPMLAQHATRAAEVDRAARRGAPRTCRCSDFHAVPRDRNRGALHVLVGNGPVQPGPPPDDRRLLGAPRPTEFFRRDAPGRHPAATRAVAVSGGAGSC